MFIFLGIGFHILSYPYVGPYYAAITNLDTSKYGGVGIYNDIVANNGMAWNAFDGISVLIQGKTFGSQGNALI